MPTVSVILNTYNSAAFLDQTLASVFAQTWSDFELLAIDDGSQDDTRDRLRCISDPRLRMYTHHNRGIAASRNRGIALAQGEYLAFLDHDDLWHPDKLAQQLATLTQAPLVAMAYCWLETMDEAGVTLRRYAPTPWSGNVYGHLLVSNFLHTASNPLIRRSAAIAVGGFDETIYGADDYDFFLRLSASYPVALSPHYHLRYRLLAQSASGNLSRMAEGCRQTLTKAFAVAPASLQPLQTKALGVVYQYLGFKALETPSQGRGAIALGYGWQSWRYHAPLWPWQTRRTFLLKALAALFLPPGMNRWLMARFRQRCP